MAANVESMFYVRETPWHGLGTRVNERKILISKNCKALLRKMWVNFRKSIRK